MKPKYEVFTTSDHKEIVGRYFEPSSKLVGAVVIASAIGVAQEYYAPLATWLSQKGFLVVTFDYRGTGLSLKGSLRGCEANLFDWANDCSTVLNELSKRVPNKSIYWIGHSLGGQIVPFVENINVVSKVITVAAGSGYWLENAWPLKRRVWWLWFVVVPLTLPFCGYFPGKRLRMVGNLPKDVMAQWRRWCLHPQYCVGVEGPKVKAQFAAIQTPIISLAFKDDEMMSKKNTESLHSFFTNAPLTMKRITPKEVGANRIGHFGFFKEKFKSSLWKESLLMELKQAV